MIFTLIFQGNQMKTGELHGTTIGMFGQPEGKFANLQENGS